MGSRAGGQGNARHGRTCIVGWVLLGLSTTLGLPAGGEEDRYVLMETYVGEDFFEKWTFYTGPDPTHGIVDFVSYDDAMSKGLAKTSWDRVYMGADATEVLTGDNGRKALKITSNSVYNSGLFVLKVDHVPLSCGSWPAFWMFGEDAQHAWPRWGEYDIVEAVHNISQAATTLHTRDHCDQSLVNSGLDFTGPAWATGTASQSAKNCFVHAPGEFSNQGCGEKMPVGSWGPALNKAGGGTWAAEWDPKRFHIRTWFFPNGMEPLDLQSKNPRPQFWGTPTSFFTLQEQYCSPGHFQNMRMVFDTTFCGDYGDATFQSACPLAGLSCRDFVQQRPQEFADAYWSILALDVYQRGDYDKFESAPLAASPVVSVPGQSNAGVWFAAGIILTILGLAAVLAIRWWPAGKVRRNSRGVPSEGDGGRVGMLLDCLDQNIEQLQDVEINLPGFGQVPGPPQQAHEAWPRGSSGSQGRQQQADPGAGARGSQSSSYVPAGPRPGQSSQQPNSTWGSFMMNAIGAYGTGQAGAGISSPPGSLPPTLNALDRGHAPPTSYQPVSTRT
eukprot:TRINITY_DN102388_c0_g1_i1.p1 TRINITY_DN102388_c0_g1~~TRINITY_DN102388_c0_g1_i1.p1  ORF type:complete len:569 (+),score=76.81 TRINITY_DN102388_c0_g1_i1:39-1709(+)